MDTAKKGNLAMAETTSIVIFGASGDLTRRKLIPSLFSLYCKQRLPQDFRILGMARRQLDDAAFRQAVQTFAPDTLGEAAWPGFAERLFFLCGDFSQPPVMRELRRRLVELEQGRTADRLYYLAIPPQVYEPAVVGLGEAGLMQADAGWRRVVVEKPFGSSLETARALNAVLHRYLKEDQIYRIDHYLGKETVQNVLVFRFGNSIFEPIWNRNYIDHVQITVAESVGVGHRGAFYDRVGVLRDMFQNHLMQLLSLVAMEPPASFEADAIRDERVKLLSSIRPVRPEEVAAHTVRARYRGYLEEPGVAPDSQTETYAAVRLHVDNWRWHGVPFYLRSGKRLAQKSTEIVIEFRRVPHMMFPLEPGEAIRPNRLAICVQPDEGIHLRFEAKVPDTVATMRSVDMTFHYQDAFGPCAIPEAYERLLLDALHGDQSLFIRADTIERAWSLIDPILEGWQRPDAPPLATYEPGSWGPEEAEAFIGAEGRAWLRGCGAHNGA